MDEDFFNLTTVLEEWTPTISAVTIGLSVAGIVADLLIICTLRSLDNLDTLRNTLIGNWALSDIFFLLAEPTKYVAVFGRHIFQVDSLVFMYVNMRGIHYIFLIFNLSFVLMLFVDFIYDRLKTFPYQLLIYFMWVVALITVFLNIVATKYICHVLIAVFFSEFFILLLIFCTKFSFYVSRRLQMLPTKSHLRLFFTTSYICCWILVGICEFLKFNNFSLEDERLADHFWRLAYSNSIIQFGVLFIVDKNFRLGFWKMLRLKRISGDKDDDSDVFIYNTDDDIANNGEYLLPLEV